MGLGLFGMLNMGARALQVQQLGIETAGRNIANAINPDYARQRLELSTDITIPTPIGPVGTGVAAVSIRHLRDAFLDAQASAERSQSGRLGAELDALTTAQAKLGEQLDGLTSIGSGINSLFANFQNLSVQPTDPAVRQALISESQQLTTQLNQADQRLQVLQTELDSSLTHGTTQVNGLLRQIANLNHQIRAAEFGAGGQANDLRDARQATIEQLAEWADISVQEDAQGTDISVDGQPLIDSANVLDTVETYDAGGGQIKVRTTAGGAPLNPGGRLDGTMRARDGAIATLRNDLDTLATGLISQLNAAHAPGFGLNDTTGANFFTGTGAGDIQVNANLVADPQKIQASGLAGAPGDNQVALALAQVGQQKHAVLSNRSFAETYGQSVSALGHAISSKRNESDTQQLVESTLLRQRQSAMGVSLDEEMTDLIRYQRAYEAAAKVIVTINEMFETVLSLKR